MIQISITTTPRQDAKLEALRLRLNKDRPDPFQSVSAMAEAAIRGQLLSWVKTVEANDGEDIGKAYMAASDAVQAQVKSLLGL